jgi:hypothetical protein
MVGLFEVAVNASSLEHVTLHDNSVIIFYFPFFVEHHSNTWAAIDIKGETECKWLFNK